jgi:N-methylhydantoinase A
VVEQGGRLGVDIGGTFTDVALEAGGRRCSAKILTTPEAPERAVLEAIGTVLREAALTPADLSIIIHGTTLATNAIIERKGAKTALLTTDGFRDTIEIRHENRFEQYDVNIDLPPPLVPRRLRFPVRERIDARGRVLVPLDETGVSSLADRRWCPVGCDRLSAQLYQSRARAPRRRDPRRPAPRGPRHLVQRRIARDARI